VSKIDRAVSKLKNVKAAGEDVIINEMVTSDGLAIVEWLVCLFNLCMNLSNALEDWSNAIIVPLLKGKAIRRNVRTIEV
jgi:hypothetical protein